MTTPNAEEIRWREWLRSLDVQPSEVDGDGRWNHKAVAATWDYVTSPPQSADTSTDDDTDGM